MASLTNPALAWEIFSFLFYLIRVESSLQNKTNFVYNGFFEANLSLDGASSMRSNGILAITNDTANLLGHAFYPTPLKFKKEIQKGHGLTFVLASKYPFKDCLPNQYLGLPNVTSNSQSSTRILAIEFDAVQNLELQDINDNQRRRSSCLCMKNLELQFRILTHVAQTLLYMHEECQQMVVHRDLKPSNILIDADLNAKLGDFGLARTYEHGNNPDTANIVGTLGYMAPDLTRTGKATPSTDVYSYGTLPLEAACGRRPIEPRKNVGELVLVDWVREQHCRGDNTRAVDPTLDDYDPEEVNIVLGLGLFCSHSHTDCRPSMGRIVQYLQRDANLTTLPTDIHVDNPKVRMEYSDSFPGDSDPSCCRMTSSKSNSFKL
ncbi:Serine/threonine protein kinase [Parasponia andersonii]|uniref:non-specific serine/threonine protein kinase n=1 Tax=Parasponia andersonii TaxID=3476 RepID=A0A2P5CF85_PARAD|nr:Serine/threonine protein kinase [Parasponia andersonii]